MSANIEPQTTAKCILYTTKGNIAVELWAKECPQTSRRFLTKLSDGTYVNGKFSELKPNQLLRFSTDGTAEKCAVAQERNPRIRFSKDGLFGWDRQRDTWFITVQADSKHVLNDCNVFGKIVGKSIYAFREILSGEIETTTQNDEVKQFMYPAVLKSSEITIPYFKDISLSKRGHDNDEEIRQQPKRKLQRSSKVKMVYEDEDDDDDDDDDIKDDVFENKPTKRMVLPAWIKDNQSVQPKPDVSVDQPQHPSSDTEPVELHDQADPPTKDPEEVEEKVIDKREQETLDMLAKFQQQIKNKKILK
ncbi:hypothetical protein SEUBUCD646_0P02200 [Saccharomyces eubayanus]|uniref:PPIase cyclophilin-type domain-containing protein n=1 Tax=Saccharomyces eubayanus TaxID=1080349 RepID=A0ABN8VP31_SACEU|nr:hypothetical protein SEUBUCD650_0P02210 [Saccharomyces eubayanus]CAI1798606.1 hypothetical protein SEUBUCD646_0P02200 [Saccharomyces eubayanus]